MHHQPYTTSPYATYAMSTYCTTLQPDLICFPPPYTRTHTHPTHTHPHTRTPTYTPTQPHTHPQTRTPTYTHPSSLDFGCESSVSHSPSTAPQVLSTASEPSSTNPKLLRKMTALATARLEGAVTSVSLAEMTNRSFTFYVGTAMCNIYKVVYEPASSRWVAAVAGPSPRVPL